MKIETTPSSWKDYELIDSGDFSKLERFGRYVLIRPEPTALWHRAMSPEEWALAAHAEFKPGAGFSKAGKEDTGKWLCNRKMEEQWVISSPSGDFNLRLGLTAFKHVGVFPEQAGNWDFIARAVKSAAASLQAPPRVLNLFAYTGAATLAACRAGAEATHLDSVRNVVSWARGNMELSSLSGIRWVVEDALKFAQREVRRGNRYNGIILDPPAYGHGPSGERWKLDECLYGILECCSALLAPKNSFLVLNLYSNGYSAALAETLVRDAFAGRCGDHQTGESVLTDRRGRNLALSVYSRFIR